VHDRTTGVTERVSVGSGSSEGDGPSGNPSISADGRYVAFYSEAANLVTGDTNGVGDVFVRDRTTGTTERVSEDSQDGLADGGSVLPSLSADGRYVAFASYATNLVATPRPPWSGGDWDFYVHDRQTGATERVSVSSDGSVIGAGGGDFSPERPSISADGRYVAFFSLLHLVPGDTDYSGAVFVRDREAGTTKRASLALGTDFGGSEPSISADGRYVAFVSFKWVNPTDPVVVFVRDLRTGAEAKGSGAFGPAMSADGRYIAFDSGATNLVADDTNGERDVFVRARW
jgi:Tol biopolymer transport system component